MYENDFFCPNRVVVTELRATETKLPVEVSTLASTISLSPFNVISGVLTHRLAFANSMMASDIPLGGAGRLNLRYIPPSTGSNLQKTGTSIFFGCDWNLGVFLSSCGFT